MIKKLTIGLLSLTALIPSLAQESADSITASEIFAKMPAKTLDILSYSHRLDLIDYMKADSVYNVMNVMEGFSHINPPMTRDYIQVQLTPVSVFTVRMLQNKKKEPIAMTIYTVGDSLLAHDSEIRFYDTNLEELDRDKYIKPLSTQDFFDFKGVDGSKRKDLLDMIPFPTVEYTIAPEGDVLKARLTVGEFLSKEVLEKIRPYLRRDRELKWNGSKFELIKM